MALPGLHDNRVSLHERLDRIDRRIRVIGRIVILIETFGAAWLCYQAALVADLAPQYALLTGVVLGLTTGVISQREFDR